MSSNFIFSSFRRVCHTCTSLRRAASNSSAPYPFSKTALTPPPSMVKLPPRLQRGVGLIEHLKKTLYTPEKYLLVRKLLSRSSPTQLRVGSIISVTSEHSPTIFTGVLIAIRRRGPDSSIRVRNILQRVGTEMQFFLNSPTVKEVKVVRLPPKGRMKRAKLYYLRNSPEKMSMLAAGKN